MAQLTLPRGTVIMYSGTLINDFDNQGKGKTGTDVEGWQICNGNNGSPNLIGKFVMGERRNAIGDTGGQNSVTLTTGNMPAHDHGGNTGDTSPNLSYPGVGYCSKGNTKGVLVQLDNAVSCGSPNLPNELTTLGENPFVVEDHQHSIASEGSGTPFDNRPSFVALVYLMKL